MKTEKVSKGFFFQMTDSKFAGLAVFLSGNTLQKHCIAEGLSKYALCQHSVTVGDAGMWVGGRGFSPLFPKIPCPKRRLPQQNA